MVAVAVGAGLMIAGVVGVVTERQPARRANAAASPASKPASPAPTAAHPSASGAETPAAFLDILAAALRNGDDNFLLTRLNPAVIDRFGSSTCKRSVASLHDPTARFVVDSVSGPAPYEWHTDNRTTTVPGTLTVTADRTRSNQTSRVTLHLTPVDGKLTWFTDCALSS